MAKRAEVHCSRSILEPLNHELLMLNDCDIDVFIGGPPCPKCVTSYSF